MIVTFIDWPGSNTPLAGLKVKFTGLREVVVLGAFTVQLNWPCAFGSSVSVTVHGLLELQLVTVVTSLVQLGALQLQGRVMSFGNPETVMVALAGQTVSGMETVAVVDWPAESEPFDGLILMPFTPLAVALQDQST